MAGWKESIGWGRPWNPMSGCGRDPHCVYCYAKRMAARLAGRFGYDAECPFKPTFHRDKLTIPYKRKEPTRWFVCTMGELWHHSVPKSWKHEIVQVAEHNPHHIFMTLTKCPEGMLGWKFPENMWCGITGETQELLESRAAVMKHVEASVKFASLEPLHGPIIGTLPMRYIEKEFRLDPIFDWIIIGAETGNRKGRIEPEEEWIQDIVMKAQWDGTAVYMKENLKPYYSRKLKRQFPVENALHFSKITNEDIYRMNGKR